MSQIQKEQNEMLRTMVGKPWRISNLTSPAFKRQSTQELRVEHESQLTLPRFRTENNYRNGREIYSRICSGAVKYQDQDYCKYKEPSQVRNYFSMILNDQILEETIENGPKSKHVKSV